jgi:site-specific DNA recombinase
LDAYKNHLQRAGAFQRHGARQVDDAHAAAAQFLVDDVARRGAGVAREDDARLAELEAERGALERDLLRGQGEVRRLLAEVGAGTSGAGVVSRLAELQERVGQVEQRIARLRAQMEAVQQERLDEAEAARALAELDPAWEAMTPGEQARIVALLVSRMDYDGARGKVAITFHPLGLKTLAGDRLGRDGEERSA